VTRVVRDIVDGHPRWRTLVAEYEAAALAGHPDRGESRERQRLRTKIDRVARRIDGYVREFDEIGCHLKGYEEGTVDFYSRYQNRLMFLCWRLGEDAISHWHELDSGFAGRQAVAPDFEGETVGRLS